MVIVLPVDVKIGVLDRGHLLLVVGGPDTVLVVREVAGVPLALVTSRLQTRVALIDHLGFSSKPNPTN